MAPLSGPVVDLSVPCTRHCSLKDNYLKAEGGMAIAAVLKETKITHLKCAPSLPPPYAHKR